MGELKVTKMTPEQVEEMIKKQDWAGKVHDGKEPSNAMNNPGMQYSCKRFRKGQF